MRLLDMVPAGEIVILAEYVDAEDLDYGGNVILRSPYGTATDEYEDVNGVKCRKFINVTGIPSHRWLLIPVGRRGNPLGSEFFKKASRPEIVYVKKDKD